MIMIIKTLNSTYEVDDQTAAVRRVSGENPPTNNFREDGLWHPATLLREPQVGVPMFFLFEESENPLTVTSKVTEIAK